MHPLISLGTDADIAELVLRQKGRVLDSLAAAQRQARHAESVEASPVLQKVRHYETDAFKDKHGVGTTPQTFIAGERVGGYTELREHFGKRVKSKDETTYQPVIAIFSPTVFPISSESSAVATVIPAEGPSFGIAPAGK